jgi:hypothetical protein
MPHTSVPRLASGDEREGKRNREREDLFLETRNDKRNETGHRSKKLESLMEVSSYNTVLQLRIFRCTDVRAKRLGADTLACNLKGLQLTREGRTACERLTQRDRAATRGGGAY